MYNVVSDNNWIQIQWIYVKDTYNG